jgi:hypothetical protein
MMSDGQSEIITDMDTIWSCIDSEVRQDWEDCAVEAAAADELVQDMVVRAAFYSSTSKRKRFRKQLEGFMEREYDAVPDSRRLEVYIEASVRSQDRQ